VEIGTAVIGKRIRNVQRFAQIANVFARHGLWTIAEAIKVRQVLTPEQAQEAEQISVAESRVGGFDQSTGQSFEDQVVGLPARLRRSFEELGPAFVKLGQVLATREDLLPASVIEELKKLHSRVQPLDFSMIEKVLKDELGEQRLKKIRSIDRAPLAAGSMAQVHKAELQTGETIVLKVQRPGIAAIIETDLSLMEVIAGLLERYLPESKSFRPSLIIEEFARATRGELDFVREGGTMSKIAANFAGVPYVDIPEVCWELSSSRVLAQSYLQGFSVYDTEALARAEVSVVELVERGLSAFMQMVFVDGFYHGDLHPGNLIVLPGNRVGIIDFGVGVLIGRATRERLAGLLMALVEEDYETMVAHFVDLSRPGSEFDIEAFTHEVSNAVAPFVGLRLSEIRSGNLLWELARIAGRHGAPMPRELILFLRTLVAFEGIGTKLDPTFDVIASCEKFTGTLVSQMYSAESLKKQGLLIARDFAQLGRYAPRQIRSILSSILAGELKFQFSSEDVGRMTESIDKSSARLAAGLIASSLIISSAVLIYAHSGQQFYGISVLGISQLALAAVMGFYILFSVFRSGKM
jgi:ubiquinone biosynthesis protein